MAVMNGEDQAETLVVMNNHLSLAREYLIIKSHQVISKHQMHCDLLSIIALHVVLLRC